MSNLWEVVKQGRASFTVTSTGTVWSKKERGEQDKTKSMIWHPEDVKWAQHSSSCIVLAVSPGHCNPLVLLSPSCPFKNISLSPSSSVTEWAMCWRINDHSEQHWTTALSMALFCCETGNNICRQAELQSSIRKNISESCEMLYLQRLGREHVGGVPERCNLCQVVKRYPEQASFCWEWAGNSLGARKRERQWITSVLEGIRGTLLHFVMSDWGDPGSLTTFWVQFSRFQPRKKMLTYSFFIVQKLQPVAVILP